MFPLMGGSWEARDPSHSHKIHLNINPISQKVFVKKKHVLEQDRLMLYNH